jgi:hypothetical protein
MRPAAPHNPGNLQNDQQRYVDPELKRHAADASIEDVIGTGGKKCSRLPITSPIANTITSTSDPASLRCAQSKMTPPRVRTTVRAPMRAACANDNAGLSSPAKRRCQIVTPRLPNATIAVNAAKIPHLYNDSVYRMALGRR